MTIVVDELETEMVSNMSEMLEVVAQPTTSAGTSIFFPVSNHSPKEPAPEPVPFICVCGHALKNHKPIKNSPCFRCGCQRYRLRRE